jgi:hypothetical protein
MIIARLRTAVMLVKISGYDNGEHGNLPFNPVNEEIARFGPIEFFVDIGAAIGAVTEVREAWTQWFQSNRQGVRKVSILVQSSFMKLAVEVTKLFSRTGELITVYSDPELFKEAIVKAAPGFVETESLKIGAPVEGAGARGVKG